MFPRLFLNPGMLSGDVPAKPPGELPRPTKRTPEEIEAEKAKKLEEKEVKKKAAEAAAASRTSALEAKQLAAAAKLQAAGKLFV